VARNVGVAGVVSHEETGEFVTVFADVVKELVGENGFVGREVDAAAEGLLLSSEPCLRKWKQLNVGVGVKEVPVGTDENVFFFGFGLGGQLTKRVLQCESRRGLEDGLCAVVL